jgi:hypothetical protein
VIQPRYGGKSGGTPATSVSSAVRVPPRETLGNAERIFGDAETVGSAECRVDRARDVAARRLDDVDDPSEERVLEARARWLSHRDDLLAGRPLHDATGLAATDAWCSSGAGRSSLIRWRPDGGRRPHASPRALGVAALFVFLVRRINTPTPWRTRRKGSWTARLMTFDARGLAAWIDYPPGAEVDAGSPLCGLRTSVGGDQLALQ